MKHSKNPPRFARWADSLLPPEMVGSMGTAARRARICIAAAVVGVMASLTAAAVRVVHERYFFAAACVVAALAFALVPALQRRTGSTRLAGHAVTGLMWASIAAGNLASGGTVQGLAMASVLVPLVGVMILGARRGAVWGALAAIQAAVAPWLGRSGLQLLLDPPADLRATMLLVAPPVAVLAALVVAVTFRRLEEGALDELAEALDTAKAASRAKSTFLASMSHELRTPMNGIVGALALLEDEPLSPTQRRNANIAMQSANTLLTLLGNVLDIAKVEAGALDVNRRPFHVGNEVRGAAEGLQGLADRAGIELRVCIGGAADRRAMGDAGRVRQIVTNLLGNALKFTETGSVDVTLESLAVGWVQLEVADTGPGIEADLLPRIFEPFVRGEACDGREGTGLGLAIVREVVEAMGGGLGVASEVGKGTTITVALPLPAEPRPLGSSSAELEELTGKRVLVVEDNQVNQLILCQLLRKLGLEPDVARDGLEGVEMWELNAYDLVLMDCQMPRLDGLAATRQIRAREPSGVRTPIVALTAAALRGDRERCIEAGMDDYLTKPVTLEGLESALRHCLARAGD